MAFWSLQNGSYTLRVAATLIYMAVGTDRTMTQKANSKHQGSLRLLMRDKQIKR